MYPLESCVWVMRTGSTWTTRPRVKDSISAPTNTAVAAISSSSSSSSSTSASGKRSSSTSLSTVASSSSSSAKKKKENSASDTSATIYPRFDDIYDSVQAEAFSETALTTVKPVINAATTTASASNAEYVLFTKYFARCICNQKQSAKPNIEERVREDLNFAKYMRPLRRWLDETLSKEQVAELGALPSIDDLKRKKKRDELLSNLGGNDRTRP